MKYVTLALSVMLTLTAFALSSQSGEVSSSLSGSISLYIYHAGEQLFQRLGIDEILFHTLIRKVAHITLYLTLGIVWTITFHQFHVPLKYAAFLGIAIALCDEGIQMLSENRGPSLVDALGFDSLSFLFSWFWIHKIKQKTPKSPES